MFLPPAEIPPYLQRPNTVFHFNRTSNNCVLKMQASRSKSSLAIASKSRSRPPTSISGSTSATWISAIGTPRAFKAKKSQNSLHSSDHGLGIQGHEHNKCEFQDSMTYTEKDEALQRLNEELERKSFEIFKKIEQYTNRSNRPPEAGDGDAPIIQNPHLPRPCTAKTLKSPSQHTTATDPDVYYDDDFESLDEGGGDEDTVVTGVPSASASLCDGEFIGSLASEDTKSIDIKARKRLQKATESVVKCLQSKLVSYEGRLADLHIQFRQKIQENTMLESKVRALEDEREKLLKTLNSLQTSSEKSSKAADLAKNNLSMKMQAFAALKKDIDTLRREQKQKSGLLQNLQTRLNRCVEENDRLKNQTRSAQMNMREKHQEDRAQIDELQQRCCQLEQQKAILNATIGKQSGLIRTLRNQKVQLCDILKDNGIQYSLRPTTTTPDEYG